METFLTLLSSIARPTDIEQWKHLRDLPIPDIDASDVNLIIGQNVLEALQPLDLIEEKDGEPYAVGTPHGWTVNGPMKGTAVEELAACHFIDASAS